MPRISLTDFVDIVAASGTPKATKVRQVKTRPEYQPAFDYYKQLREGIEECHRSKAPKGQLDDHVGDIRDPKKVQNYKAILAGYKRWWGRKDLRWFEAPSELFSRAGVDVGVNPELGLRINGAPHLIKLYFKADPLSKSRVDVITHLMETCLRSGSPGGTTMAVLDTRRNKLICPTVPIPGLDAALSGEMAYIAALWNEV